MKTFVTGATGFIGSYLVKWLVDEGHDVVALQRSSSNKESIGSYNSKVKWLNTDDPWQAKIIEYKPDIIYNLAWKGVSSTERAEWQSQMWNINFQQQLLNLAVITGCKKFVGIGSQSEYGDFSQVIDENYTVAPKTAYAAVKVACLDIMRCFCETNNIEWYWFRLFPLFGPFESDKWLIPSLIKKMMTQDSMELTAGEQRLPYLYVGECAKAIGHAIYAHDKGGIYNVASDNPRPLKELIQNIRNYVRPSFKLLFGALPYRYGQSMVMASDTSSLCDNIYKIDNSTFEEHLLETVNFYIAKYGYKRYN